MEQALASVEGIALDVDTMMAVFGAVNAFARGTVSAAEGILPITGARGWEDSPRAR
jgi:hypothetical protein